MPSTLANLEPTVREAQRFLGKLGEDIYQVPPDIGDTMFGFTGLYDEFGGVIFCVVFYVYLFVAIACYFPIPQPKNIL